MKPGDLVVHTLMGAAMGPGIVLEIWDDEEDARLDGGPSRARIMWSDAVERTNFVSRLRVVSEPG